MQTRIISFINHKGGVGKTTSTLNLGKALSLEGKKVLLIDNDPQSNLTQSLGKNGTEPSLYDALCESTPMPILEIAPLFFLCPANLTLSFAEAKLQAEQVTGYFKLKNILKELQDENFDFILIDCPPSLSVLTMNALLASNEMLIVLEPQYLSITGLQTILNLHQRLRNELNAQIKITGFLFNRFGRTVVNKSIVEQVQESYKELVLPIIIRQNAKIAEASIMQQDIFTYDSQSMGAEDFAKLARCIISNP
jgi:chromosome partitioning protein